MNDVPQRYLESLIEAKATIICDDMLAMEERNVNALALLFSRKGQKLSEIGPSVGVKHYSAIRADKSLLMLYPRAGDRRTSPLWDLLVWILPSPLTSMKR
nr:hypothetical protein K4M19_00272 [Agrobacterium fabrum]